MAKILEGSRIGRSGRLTVGCSAAVFDRSHSVRDQNTIPLFKQRNILWLIFTAICLVDCSDNATKPNDENLSSEKPQADVISVAVNVEPNAYVLSVEILSPDTGCDQYADWWEVLSENGSLIYRRILAHSHANEQPFVRSGRPVRIEANEIVYVRGHMHPGGYGGSVHKGSVQNGFQEVTVSSDFALAVEKEAPQPSGCAF